MNRNYARTDFAYDPLGRPTGRLQLFAQPGYDAEWSYGFNPASGIASVTRSNDVYAWQGHYQVSRAYTTNGLNQYSQAGGATFGYDANGNLTSDGTHTFTYDVENRLVTRSGGVTLRYDPLGRLWQVASGAGTTSFSYDGDALVEEHDSAGALTRRHVHWPGADVPMITYEGTNPVNARQLISDHQGSIIASVDMTGGNHRINRYDEYGIPASTNTGRFQYTGQIWLPELGMYYYKGRMYSPTLGRFPQTDSVGYEGGINLYAYVGNDPVNMVDPDGTCGTRIQDAISASCSGGTVLGLIGDWREKQQPAQQPRSALGHGMDASGGGGDDRASWRDYDPVSIFLSALTGFKRSPSEINRDVEDFLRSPVRNGLEVAAAFPAGRTLRAGARAINFGLNPRAADHAWRHVISRGLSVRTTRNAILRDAGSVLEGLAPGQTMTRTIQTQGQSVVYRIHRLPDGTVNIGSIRPPR